MKNKELLVKTIIGVFVLLIAVLTGLYIKNNIVLNKTYGYATGITNIAQYVDDNNYNVSSASFIISNIDPVTMEPIVGNKVRVYSVDDNVTLSFLDTKTNDELEVNNNVITLNETGITVKVDGISKGNTYDIRVEPVELNRGYKASYKTSTIKLDYTEVLSAYISEIIDENNNPIELSEQEKMIFLYTDSDDKIKLRANEDINIEYVYSLDELSEEELANATFTEYNKDNYLKVETNGYLYAKAKYKNDSYSKISMLHITNIDKLVPEAYDVVTQELSSHDAANVSFKVRDLEGTKEYGKSGVKEYVFSKFDTLQENQEWTPITEGEQVTTTVIDNGPYYVHIKDNAGNIGVTPIDVTISFEQTGYYILILNADDSSLIGKIYHTLFEFKEDLDAHNLTNDSHVLAQLEGDIKNQYMDVENVNLTFDLNGYILESRETEPTFNVKDGATLKVVDYKYDIKEYLDYNDTQLCTNIANSHVFEYTGDEQTYVIPETGIYNLEAWGAQGGSYDETVYGGYGGYSAGSINLNKDTTLYINVGGQGGFTIETGTYPGGYNGGGNATRSLNNNNETYGSGGGASSIALVSGELKDLEEHKGTLSQDRKYYVSNDIIMVAGGGGGSGYGPYSAGIGGSGGGFKGTDGTSTSAQAGRGGVQTEPGGAGNGGQSGLFGQGIQQTNGDKHSGAGGGFYGGGTGNGYNTPAGGGSGYIANPNLFDKYMAVYSSNNGHASNDTETKTLLTQRVSNIPMKDKTKMGNGIVRISQKICFPKYIDYDYDTFVPGENYGTIRNVNHDAIVINEGATLELGEDNSPDLAHVEYPDHHSPYIVGKEKAIKNRGTFKYYDGVIYGGVALDGDVQDSPYIYDPSVVIPEGDTNYRMTLERVTNIEALIGKTRYTLLEDAIDAANNRRGTPEDQIKIDIVSDLSKSIVIDVNDQKNIILDLNGHRFTNVIDDPIITNEGKLVIMDSVSSGTIFSHTANTIVNNSNATLTIESGIINNDVKNKDTILNNGDAKLIVNGGTIIQSNEGNVINNTGGILEINDGYLSGPAYGIWANAGEYGNIVYNHDTSSEEVDEIINVPISNPTQTINSNCGFEVNTQGYLKPTNESAFNGSICDSYIVIDLSNEPGDQTYILEESVYLDIRSNDYFYSYWRNDDGIQWWHNGENRFVFYNNTDANLGDTTFTTTIRGGKKYYVHFAHISAGIPHDNVVTIKGVKLIKHKYQIGRSTINGGDFAKGHLCFNNESYFQPNVINDGVFSCDYSAFTKNGDVIINGGTFKTQIVNGDNKTFYVNGGEIANFLNRKGIIRMTGGRLGILYNRMDSGNFHDQLDNYAYITGGEIYDFIENYQTLDIKDAYITGSIYQYSYIPLTIDNTTFYKEIKNSDREFKMINIDTPTGDVSIKDSTFTADLESRSDYYYYPNYIQIYKTNDSLLAIDNSTFNLVGKNKYTGDLGDRRFKMIRAIYNTGDGDIYIDNSQIKTSLDHNQVEDYCIYNEGKADINIGKHDSNYNENQVTFESNYSAIYSPNGNINFYDGIIKANNNALKQTIHENEDGFYVYRFDNNGVDTIKLVANSLGNVLNVNTNVTYNSLGEALDAAGDTAKLRFLNNYNYETKNRTYEIKNNQNITIDLNGKNVFLGNGFINNGILKFIDESGSTAKVKSQVIVNNNDLTISTGDWSLEIDGADAIINNGITTISNATLYQDWCYNRESIILNNNKLYIEDDTTLTVNNLVAALLIHNRPNSETYINGGLLDVSNDPTWTSLSAYGRAVLNEGGYVEMNDGVINGHSKNYNGFGQSIKNISILPENVDGIDDNEGYIRVQDKPARIPLDLTSYTGDVKIIIKYQGDQWGNNKKGMIAITQSETRPTQEQDNDYVFSEDTNDGTFEKTIAGGANYNIHIYEEWPATFYLNDIIIEQNGVQKSLFNRAKFVINGGRITDVGDEVIIYNYNTDFEINGGTIEHVRDVSNTGVLNLRGTVFKMTGGKIQNNKVNVHFKGYSKGYMTGGEISVNVDSGNGRTLINNEEGILDIQNVNVLQDVTVSSSDNQLVYNRNKSKLNINGGNYLLKSDSNQSYSFVLNEDSEATINNITLNTLDLNVIDRIMLSILMNHNAKLNISNSTVNTNGKEAYGIYTKGNNIVNINNTSIIATGATSYGYFAEGYSTPTITLSNEDTNADGYVSQTSPVLSGNTYGMYRRGGVFNFYDGIIKGETQIFGGVTDRPVGYELVYGNDGNLPTVVLDKLAVIQNTDTGVEYETLQSAFDACPDNSECNLKQLYPILLSSNQTLSNNKIVNYNLNSLSVSTKEDGYIVNNGSLKIYNGTLESQGVDNGDPIIQNNGTLNIENGTTLTIHNLAAARLIYNKKDGKLYINGGSFIANQDPSVSGLKIDGRIIYNEGGYVEINGGSFDCYSVNYSGSYGQSFKNLSLLPENVDGIDDNEGYIRVFDKPARIPLDLTSYTGDVKIIIKYQGDQWGNNKKGMIAITQSETRPTQEQDNDYVFSEDTNDATFEKTIAGGANYNIHIYEEWPAIFYLNDIIIEQNGVQKSLFNRARMVINDGTFVERSSGSMIINYNSDMELNGGSIKSYNYAAGIAVDNRRGSNFTMTGGNINNIGTSLLFKEYAHGTITGGTLTQDGQVNQDYIYALRVEEGYVDVRNLNINFMNVVDYKDKMLYYIAGNSVVNVDGGTYRMFATASNTRAFALRDNSQATINNISFAYVNNSSDTKYGITLEHNSKVEVNNSTFDVTSTDNIAYGIYTNSETNIDINNSTFNATGGIKGYGLFVEDLVAPVITMSNKDGNEDGSVSTTSSVLSGNTYGMYRNGGVFNFYDGIIKGGTALDGGVSNRTPGYNLRYGTSGSYKTLYLDKFNVVMNTDTGVEYDNLQSAFNNCPDNDECHLKQLYDINLFENNTIPGEKNIIFDGNTYSIYAVANAPVNSLINYGTFKYSNGTISGKSISDRSSTISNYGKLYIEDGSTLTTNTLLAARLIYNEPGAELYINGGLLESNRTSDHTNKSIEGRVIYNDGGYVEINDGTIDTLSRSFYGTAIGIKNISNASICEDCTITNGYIDVIDSTKRIPIDLTEYSGDVEVIVKYNNTSDENSYGSITLTDSNVAPVNQTGVDTLLTSNQANATFTKTVSGGRTYNLFVQQRNLWKNLRVTDIIIRNNSEEKRLIDRGKFVINGGEIIERSDAETIQNYNADIIVNGGTIKQFEYTAGYGVKSYLGSNIYLNGGSMINKNVGFEIDEQSNLYVNNYNILIDSNTGILLNDGNATINNINIAINNTSENNYPKYGILMRGTSIVNLYGGNINLNTLYGSGIYVDTPTGILNIGKNDGVVNQQLPHITGTAYGLYIRYDESTVNFYDGRITSPDTQIQGIIDDIPNEYRIVAENDDYFLDIRSSIEDTFEYNHMYFAGLSMPIAVIEKLESKTGTIKLWNDVTIHEPVEIPAGLNITIALEGHQLSFDEGIENGFINNGTLTIIDGDDDSVDQYTESYLINQYGVAIQNNGTLTIGASNGLNRHSPHIKGTTAITGNPATLLSGKIESTDGGIIQTVGAFLSNLFTFDMAPSSYAYKTDKYAIYTLSDDTVLATSPTYRSIESLEEWTNKDINVGMTSHNVGILNLVSTRDPNQTKEVEYTIEVYKNGILDEFYTFRKTDNVQYFDDEIISVDLDWFDGVENKFKGYYLTRMTINDDDTRDIPEIVRDGTKFKLYYGQTKGEEIELNNPKTGRKSYKFAFLIALIATIVFISFLMSRYIKRLQIKEDTI